MSPTFDSRSPSGMGYSDTSSIAESAHSGFTSEHDTRSNTSQATAVANPNQRKGHSHRSTGPHRVYKPTHKAIAPAMPSPLLSPRKPSFECPFCWELSIPSSISRKADLKRHFKQFHQNNAQWICPERGCSMAFDWKSAFEAHLKEQHHNAQHPPENHQVKLCHQVVFACGFKECRLVFEASSDDDAEKKGLEYFNHVANHFDDNLTHRNWSYTVRIRNLMRQAAVDPYWKERKKGAQDPKWQPHTSSVVRKILETRHFTDIQLLVQWVVHLGANPFCEPYSPIPKLPAELRLPIKENCTMTIDGHRPSFRHDQNHPLSIEHGAPQPNDTVEVDNGLATSTPAAPAAPAAPEPVYTQEMPEPIPEPMPLHPFDADQMESYHGFHHDIIPHLDDMHQISVTSNDVPTIGAASHQPITHWMGIEHTTHGLTIQPHLDTIMGYPHGNHHHHHHHSVLGSNGRPVTPAQQMLVPTTTAAGGYGTVLIPQQPPGVLQMDHQMDGQLDARLDAHMDVHMDAHMEAHMDAPPPMDADMEDYKYEPEANRF
ncbi:hypothetical protein B0H67DRAFT_244787 [Lasiosphaeris hirsuta]|uniref:C2H2-type domain-containing protein n=1 Tax=Lasiosphaeris hirsuta TaxID=260670 RepID=A0AA40AH12_9PEZI|nr:hypothetical protein B0H67DRAFT_244787 [Lasiosphaeris hirsuta]